MLLVHATVARRPGLFARWSLPKHVVADVAVLLASEAAARGRLPCCVVTGSALFRWLALFGVLLSATPAAQLWGRWPR